MNNVKDVVMTHHPLFTGLTENALYKCFMVHIFIIEKIIKMFSLTFETLFVMILFGNQTVF